MATIDSRVELRKYILRQLGSPIHSVEVSTEQLDDCIDTALEYFENVADSGVQEKLYIIDLYEGTSEYLLDTEVMGISEIHDTVFISSDDLLSQHNQMRMNAAPGGFAGGISTYVTNMQYMSFINQYLRANITFNYNSTNKKLFLLESPIADGVLVLSVFWSIRNDPETFNNNFIKEYSTALCMRQWGINMSKFEGATIVGGMTLNGGLMLDIANTDIERLREELMDKETAPLPIFFG